MTETPWTKGRKWQFIRWADDGAEIFDADTDEAIARVADGPNDLEIARLISCAPELVEALEVFAEAADDLDDDHRDHQDIWEAAAAMSITAGHLRTARAVLAKARGE